MNPRLARFLTRLYPPVWRARYGEEYRTFLEARSVSTGEILNVIWRAGAEHVLEDWRYVHVLIGLLFSVEGGSYVAVGHPGEVVVQHPAMAVAWLAVEAGALAVMMYALSIVILGDRTETLHMGTPSRDRRLGALTISALAIDIWIVGATDRSPRHYCRHRGDTVRFYVRESRFA